MTPRMYQLEGPTPGNGFVRDLIDKLFRRKSIMLGLLALWTAVMVAYVLARPPEYKEEIRFLIRNNRVGVPLTPGTNDGPISRDYVDEATVATEIQILSNLNLLRAVVDKCQLAAGTESGEKAVRDLKKDLKIGPVLKANMIKADYSSSDPHQVEAVLRALSDGYLSEHLRAHGANGAYEVFEKEATYYADRLKDLQDQLTEFQSKNRIVLLREQKDINVRHLLELEANLRTTQTARVANTRKMRRLSDQLATLQPTIMTQSRRVPNQYSIERLNTMLVELQNRRTQLLTKFQPEDRLIHEVDKQIADTQTALKQANASISTEQTSDVNPLRQSAEAELAKARIEDAQFDARESGLKKEIAEAKTSLNFLRDSTGEEEQLTRQIKEAEANFFLYSKKREDARIESAMDQQRISNVVLIEPPYLPTVPVPRVSVTVVVAYLLGCLLIIGLRLAFAFADQTIYNAWELEGFTGIPVLASVPLRGLVTSPRQLSQPSIPELQA
jgi:polysaccharide biosynthesis protein PslE